MHPKRVRIWPWPAWPIGQYNVKLTRVGVSVLLKRILLFTHASVSVIVPSVTVETQSVVHTCQRQR